MPRFGFPSPSFSERITSLNVLAVTLADGGLAVAPRGGFDEAAPCSAALLGLKGMAATSSCVPSTFWTSASRYRRSWPPRAGPLTVERALVAVPPASPDGLRVRDAGS